MPDIFGHTNSAKGAQIASSNFAVVAIGNGGPNALAQSVEVQYSQKPEPFLEIGNPTVSFVPGRPQGSVSMSTAVGPSGFFSDWKGECGKISTGSVRVKGGRCGISGSGSLKFDGGIVESVSATITVQQQQITQSAVILIASMSAS